MTSVHPFIESVNRGSPNDGSPQLIPVFRDTQRNVKQIKPLLTQMCQFSGTTLQARQKQTLKTKEINLSGHFLHSCFELTRVEIG